MYYGSERIWKNGLSMINVHIKELKTDFFLENVLRSHGSTSMYDQVRILFKILQELIRGKVYNFLPEYTTYFEYTIT